MSITVANLMNLPSLRIARVVGGKQGLGRIVSAVTVLEAVDVSELEDMERAEPHYAGSELVITGFINAKDDVDLQCASLQYLAQSGSAGLVLYYVGIDVPRIDTRLIRLSDQLNFPLIAMPEKRTDLRYSEVISEVMEAIILDRVNTASLFSDVFEQLSRLSDHYRTIDTVLHIISNTLHLTLALRDGSGRIINLACWPAGDEAYQREQLAQLPASGGLLQEEKFYCSILDIPSQEAEETLQLLVAGQAREPDGQLLGRILEIVKLFVGLYKDNRDEALVSELVGSIMQDKPLKMRRLGEVFHINVDKLDTLWVLSIEDDRLGALQILYDCIPPIYDVLQPACDICIADVYEQSLLIFFKRPGVFSEYRQLAELVLGVFPADARPTISQHTSCSGPADVRSGYREHKELIPYMRRVFPHWRVFQAPEFSFVRQCLAHIAEGENEIERQCHLLNPILQQEKGDDLVETLSTYLLDASGSIQETSQLLFMHRSTIKYRMSKIADLLGFRPDIMPNSLQLHFAVAIRRLLA